MIDPIDRNELINNLNKVAMEHHERHVPMVEHDFRELIHNAKTIDLDSSYENEFEDERRGYK